MSELGIVWEHSGPYSRAFTPDSMHMISVQAIEDYHEENVPDPELEGNFILLRTYFITGMYNVRVWLDNKLECDVTTIDDCDIYRFAERMYVLALKRRYDIETIKKKSNGSV